MIVSSHDGDDEHSYSDYDNRPIRPMNQEALNETLARLPILIDDEDYVNRTTGSSESNTRSFHHDDFSSLNLEYQ